MSDYHADRDSQPEGRLNVAENANAALRTGVRLEVFTVAWMFAEAVLAIGAGVGARSVLLTGFGFDSVIELLSGVTLLWRLSSEARGLSAPNLESVERRATRISAVLLGLLEGSRFAKDVIPFLSGVRLAAAQQILVGVVLVVLMIRRPEGLLPEKPGSN